MSTNGKFLQEHQEANPVLDLSDNQCFLPASMASHHSRCLYAKGLFVLEMILANPLHTTNYVATYASKEERAAAKYRVNAIFFAFASLKQSIISGSQRQNGAPAAVFWKMVGMFAEIVIILF